MDLEKLLIPEIQEWIEKNANENPHKLALKKSPFGDIPMHILAEQIAGKQKFSKKVPFLSKAKNIIFPPKINIEQTSSWDTALYKANLIKAKKIVDITGGFGIDCMAFSEKFKEVYHIEQNSDLQKIAELNFKNLDLKNIQSKNLNGLSFLDETHENFDVIYADPSRRDDNKNRVFKIEDLTPSPLEIILKSLDKTNYLMLKLSPMLDLKDAVNKLENIKEIHIVSVKNELKELLFILQNNKTEDIKIHCVNLQTNQPEYIFNNINDLEISSFSTPLKYLYEPNASIMKSGAFNRIAKDFGLKKLDLNTHLYTSNDLINDFPGEIYTDIKSIENPKKYLKNKSIRFIKRNFPNDLQKLKKQYKFKTDGTEIVIFTSSINGVHILTAKSLNK
ncbi:class I SAM-dependent methyltransferase [Weeksellaceae bacterium TAE3-ERU29]|nr:class I SAM-dependent methyltransferase [Weeksellaceae bacterium TAE3-ERU29]